MGGNSGTGISACEIRSVYADKVAVSRSVAGAVS